jgi:rubrerythrin
MMTTIQINIPDEIARIINSFSQPKEEFVLEAIEEKIRREKGKVKLAERGISEVDALTQRAAFATFSEDWDSPEMDAYDKL